MDMLGIKTSIISADTGSFKKAAEQSHLTVAAVIKRINKLAAELTVPLFDRSFRGLVLTKAGEVFYQDAQYLLRYSESAAARAKAAVRDCGNVVRIGNTIFTPTYLISIFWNRVNTQGMMAGMFGGIITAMIWGLIPALNSVVPTLYVGIVVSITALLIVTHLFPPPSKEQLDFIRPLKTAKWKEIEERQAAEANANKQS